MNALMLLLLAHCFVPEDQAAGWKQTPIPANAPALAAPAEIEQFRTGERALVVEEAAHFEHSVVTHVGRAVVSFEVPRGAQHLRVRFAQSLDGMRVDARAVDPRGRVMLILDDRRVASDTVMLDWGPVEMERIEVTLHHHLRPRPVVAQWRAGSWEVVSELPGVPEPFRRPGTLSWRHPGGRRVQLCDAPGRRLEVHGRSFFWAH
jgi:hypothetical protein